MIFKNTCLFVFLAFLSFPNVKAQESSIFDVARNGSLMEIKALTKNNPDIINNLSKEGYSVLTLACYYSNNDVATYLIEHVKDVNSKSGYGSALMAATVKKNTELVKLLLENNANPDAIDKNGSTALHFAVIFGYEEIIKLLVDVKADSSLKDNRGNTALDYAKITGNKKITQLLKQQ